MNNPIARLRAKSTSNWAKRIGPDAANDMGKVAVISLLLSVSLLYPVSISLWILTTGGLDASSGGGISKVVGLVGIALWLLMGLWGTFAIGRLQKRALISAARTLSYRHSRVILIPFSAIRNLSRFDAWYSTLGLGPATEAAIP